MKNTILTFAFALCAMLSFGQVVISEINFNPCPEQGQDGKYEFVEFYNVGGDGAIDLSGCSMPDLGFTFPQGTTIDKFEFIVVARRAYNYPNLTCQLFDWPNEMALHNQEDTVTLLDANGDEMCSVTYVATGVSAWPNAADNECYSFELDNAIAGILVYGVSSNPEHYVSHTLYGSPGRHHLINDPTIDTPAGTRTLCQNFKADYVGAEMYTFVFTSQTDGSQTLHDSAGNTSIQLRDVGLNVNTTYDVTVNAYKNGYWIVGETSTELTIEAQTVSVDASTSCANGSVYLGDYVNANPFVCGGDHWEWTFREVGVAGFPIVHTTNSPNRFLQLEDVVGLNEGTTYEVFVAAVYPDGSKTPISASQCVEIYGDNPTPPALRSFTLDTFSGEEPTLVKIVNTLGQVIDADTQGLQIHIYDNGTTKKVYRR